MRERRNGEVSHCFMTKRDRWFLQVKITHTNDFLLSIDHLLAYAHLLYASEATNPSPGSPLISLLQTISNFHKSHLPTLLLLACVFYTQRNYKMSLHYNQLILNKDPNYVEAMSNIGTTLRSMGRQSEAESWWWKAVRLRPG